MKLRWITFRRSVLGGLGLCLAFTLVASEVVVAEPRSGSAASAETEEVPWDQLVQKMNSLENKSVLADGEVLLDQAIDEFEQRYQDTRDYIYDLDLEHQFHRTRHKAILLGMIGYYEALIANYGLAYQMDRTLTYDSQVSEAAAKVGYMAIPVTASTLMAWSYARRLIAIPIRTVIGAGLKAIKGNQLVKDQKAPSGKSGKQVSVAKSGGVMRWVKAPFQLLGAGVKFLLISTYRVLAFAVDTAFTVGAVYMVAEHGNALFLMDEATLRAEIELAKDHLQLFEDEYQRITGVESSYESGYEGGW